MSGKREDSNTIAVAERRIKALAYRKMGASYRSIAETLHSSHPTIIRDIRAMLAELASEQQAEALELRALEAARLDDLQSVVWQQARNGNLKAVQTVLRIMERRARLLGLDAQPDALILGDVEITIRWPNDRTTIDVTPTNGDTAAALPGAAGDSQEPGAVPDRVGWAPLWEE